MVHAWRPGHWYTWMFGVEHYNASTKDYTFGTLGGNQGGEGADAAGEWWVEGMREDLDAPNEFWCAA